MAVIDDLIEKKARMALKALGRRAHVRGAYLFGSHVEGRADKWSDIDVAAFIDEAAVWNLERRVEVCVQVCEEAGDDVELHLFPAEHLTDPPRASFAQYVLRHGKPLTFDTGGTDA